MASTTCASGLTGKWLVAAVIMIGVLGCSAKSAPNDDSVPTNFAREVRPLLEQHCYKCHGPDLTVPSGKLRLDTRTNMLKGGRSGKPAIIPGDGEASPLVIGISGGEYESWRPMPPRGRKLSGREIALIQRWIDEGASIGSTAIPRNPR